MPETARIDDPLATLKQYAWRGKMEDPLGRVWSARYRASNEYHKDHSYDWEENRQLLVDFRKMVSRYGTYVAVGYAVLQNLVTDIYFRNPDTWVESKDGNKDLSRMLSGVFTAIHAEVKTERKMKEALFDAGWSLGAVAIDFAQYGHEEFVPFCFEDGSELVDDDGNIPTFTDEESGEEVPLAATDETGAFLTQTIVDKQHIVEKRISPWRLRFDPDGLDWELEDHKYIFVKFTRTLGQCLRDGRFSEEGKQKLIAWFAQRNSGNFQNLQKISYSILGGEERDPEFLMVELVEAWDRVNKQRIYFVSDYGAEWTLGTQPWPQWLADADKFPVRVIAFDREPENEDGTTGFYPVPPVRRIKPHLYNINRLEALFMEGNTHVVNKYVTPQGLFTAPELTKLTSDKNREVITYDPKALNGMFGNAAQPIGPEAARQLFFRVDQPDNREMKHIEAIAHEMNMIAQILGQSSADRGGLAVAGSATEALGLQQRLQQRLSEMREQAAKHYNAITEIMFLALKSCQVLPIKYRMTGEYNEQVWAEFASDQWETLDLHFNYSTAPQEARTREQEMALRQQVLQVVMPVAQELGDVRLIKWLLMLMVEPMNVPGVEKMLGDDASAIAAQLLQLDTAIRNGQVRPGDQNVALMKQELTSQLVDKTISNADLQQVATGGQQAGGGGGGRGTPPNPARSAGQKAAAMAAAGQVGGMSKGAVN